MKKSELRKIIREELLKEAPKALILDKGIKISSSYELFPIKNNDSGVYLKHIKSDTEIYISKTEVKNIIKALKNI